MVSLVFFVAGLVVDEEDLVEKEDVVVNLEEEKFLKNGVRHVIPFFRTIFITLMLNMMTNQTNPKVIRCQENLVFHTRSKKGQ